MHIPFTKMQGLGNDFIVIDGIWAATRALSPFLEGFDLPELARKMCRRRLGIGADQILWLRKPKEASHDIRMEIFNADGSVAEMCGNGIRAVALYLDRYGTQKKSSYRVETLAGTQRVEIRTKQVQEQAQKEVQVDMGPPQLQGGFLANEKAAGEEIIVFGSSLRFYEVSMGNPHAVFFTDEILKVTPEFLKKWNIEQWGPEIEKHPRFPQRTNVEFVTRESEHSIHVQVWERGAGVTLACGTGACAAAVAALATGRVDGPVTVHMPGGPLQITWQGRGSSVLMQGTACEVFQGVYFTDPFEKAD